MLHGYYNMNYCRPCYWYSGQWEIIDNNNNTTIILLLFPLLLGILYSRVSDDQLLAVVIPIPHYVTVKIDPIAIPFIII